MSEYQYDYAVIVSTNLYAGNFERQLCAYVFGAYGECEVGEELANEAREELDEDPVTLGLYDYTDRVSDDNGCYRPCSIHLNDDREYNDVAIYLERPLSQEQLNVVRERVDQFAKESRDNVGSTTSYSRTKIAFGDLNILGIKMIKRDVAETITEMASA